MTTRTPGQKARRRAIADAAGGFPTREIVVLYACLARGQNQRDVMSYLRRYAEARDWRVVGEIVDHTTTSTPLAQRPKWPEASLLITSGQARGIVTTSLRACADTPSTPFLSAWLTENQAFLSEALPAPTTAKGAVR